MRLSPQAFWALMPLALVLVTTPASADLKLQTPSLGISANDEGEITLLNAQGQPRLQIGDYHMMWSPGTTAGGTATQFTTAEGTHGIQVDYRLKDDPTGKIHIIGRFVPKANQLQVDYDIEAPAETRGAGALLEIRAAGPKSERSIVRLGRWQRDDQGGVPYEVPDTSGVFYAWKNEAALIRFTGCNLNWCAAPNINAPAKAGENGHFMVSGTIDFANSDNRAESLAAQLSGRPLTLGLSTDQPFNVWDKGGNLPFRAETVNVTDTAKPVTLSWSARDFQGKVVSEGSRTRDLAPRESWTEKLTVPAPDYGIFFVEVQAKSGDATTFSRTNLAVVPPHKFGPADGNIFGISAYFAHPSEDEALAMLQRIGVRWLRGNGRNTPQPIEQLEKHGIRQNFAKGFLPTDAAYQDPAKTRDFLRENFIAAAGQRAPYWEICNEWNMVGGINKGTYARQYAEAVLTPAAAVRDELKSPVKIMTQGLAGGDMAFIDALHEAGAWEHFDAFGLHPGRGNYTPDYDGSPLTPGGDGEFWNFLGTIRKVKERLAKYGDKPLFLTEAYACTQENAIWHDTYRHAAENVVLSYALALSEGVKQMDWYQFNDSVWFNQGGVSATDPEYHYGLVNRDLSLKPSALAYRTIAIALDGAKFVRWLKFEDPNNRGLLFDTPQGPLSVLWNRADGYKLNQNQPAQGKHFSAPEVWVDDWKTKAKVTLPATAARVKEIDCIGQENLIQAQNGRVTLELDGAPRLFYGVAAP